MPLFNVVCETKQLFVLPNPLPGPSLFTLAILWEIIYLVQKLGTEAAVCVCVVPIGGGHLRDILVESIADFVVSVNPSLLTMKISSVFPVV